MTLILCSRSRFRRTVINLIRLAKTRLRCSTVTFLNVIHLSPSPETPVFVCVFCSLIPIQKRNKSRDSGVAECVSRRRRVQLETHLHERGATIERFEADHRWLAEHEQDEREGKKHISKEREGENTRTSAGTEYPQRRLHGPLEQTRRTLSLHVPEARCASHGAHLPRVPSRLPLRRAPCVTRRGGRAAPRPCAYNWPTILRRQRRRTSHGMTQKRPVGSCCVVSLRARQNTRGSH
ncbi:hypothetical protein EDB92DRAFT_792340 [Lactarius akahatsu]|uniref:Uncharacterized protein n=1 Tax=Lactarius akahatsu TaxID=416441 RepID=A0AAD4Q7I7_9AGAM|nr:hypothetical protein EDB92DRAFT_792340 [Lactarius akahatsu]